MLHPEDEPPLFNAVKTGRRLELGRDPHPDATGYLVIEGPELLVMFPEGRTSPSKVVAPGSRAEAPSPPEPPDRERQLCRAFAALGNCCARSPWTSSATPYDDLVGAFGALVAQPPVAEDVTEYLAKNPAVVSAAEMLFTSMAMSARADWRATPAHVRGVAARGWFLGRWIPTFLVLDGPVLRFLKSTAFRRQNPTVPLLRAVRSFFDTKDFMLLRHAFAHWSFSWVSEGGDSLIVGLGDAAAETVRATRAEIDALHIVTFALIEAVDEMFLRERR